MAKYDPDRIAETADPLAPGSSGVEPTCDEFGRIVLAPSGGGGGGGAVDQGTGNAANPWYVSGVNAGVPERLATRADQAIGNGLLDNIDIKIPALGQANMAASVPVAIASNQSAVPISDAGGSITIDAASLPLPSGASTATNQEAIRDRIDPVWIAASTNLVGSKAARVLTLFGRRTVSTFVNATQYHDLASYATVDAAVADMTGSEALEIVSSSVNDTAAGIGARTVKIWYIDALAGDVEATATVTLNGTTPVALGAGIRAKNIQWMEVRTAGIANHNEGAITLRTAGAGTTWEQIPALQRRSFSARYMVPAGAVAYIKSPRFTAIAQRMDFALLANESEDGTNLGNVYIPHHPSTLPANASSPVLEAPDHKFSAGTRIKFAAIAAATVSNPTASAEFTALQIAL